MSRLQKRESSEQRETEQAVEEIRAGSAQKTSFPEAFRMARVSTPQGVKVRAILPVYQRKGNLRRLEDLGVSRVTDRWFI